MTERAAAIGIIGGSGLYQMEGVENPTEQQVQTPFGGPDFRAPAAVLGAASAASARVIRMPRAIRETIGILPFAFLFIRR